jgi:hypothetical protein
MSAKEYGWFNRPRLHRRTGKPNKILAPQIANVIRVTFGSDRNFWGVIKSCVRVSADKLRAHRLGANNYSYLISSISNRRRRIDCGREAYRRFQPCLYPESCCLDRENQNHAVTTDILSRLHAGDECAM